MAQIVERHEARKAEDAKDELDQDIDPSEKAKKQGERTTERLRDLTLEHAIKKRLTAHDNEPKNVDYTQDYLCERVLKSRLLKPQRLVSLTAEEEGKRCQAGWQLFDQKMDLIAFGDEEALKEEGLVEPQRIIEHRKDCVIAMSDQIPCFIKIKSGKVLYADHECSSVKKDRVDKGNLLDNVAKHCTSQKVGVAAAEAENDGSDKMTQLRGESYQDQDKFRVTVDTQQKILHFFDEDKVPEAVCGVTSVTFTGQYCRLSNISRSKPYTWIEDEVFEVGDKVFVRKANETIPSGLAQELLRIRDEMPVFWQELEKEKIEAHWICETQHLNGFQLASS